MKPDNKVTVCKALAVSRPLSRPASRPEYYTTQREHTEYGINIRPGGRSPEKMESSTGSEVLEATRLRHMIPFGSSHFGPDQKDQPTALSLATYRIFFSDQVGSQKA